MDYTIMNNPNFKAYTQLTLVSRFKQYKESGKPFASSDKSISFTDFNKLLERESPVDKKNSRDISIFHQRIINDNLRHSANRHLNLHAQKIIEKAFNLGIVNEEEVLISTNDYKSI